MLIFLASESDMFNPIQKLRFAIDFFRLVREPNRVDIVLGIAERTGSDPDAARDMLARPAVREFLAGKQKPLRVSLPALRAMPDGSLGRAFAAFLDDRGFDPTGLYHSGDADSTDLDRFKVHMQRSHDLWHTVVGFDTDIAGELGLQAFGLAQLGTPLAHVIMSAGLLGALLFDRDDGERRMEAITRGWQLGKRARPLFGADWESMFTWPLDQVRARFGIAAADIHATSLAA